MAATGFGGSPACLPAVVLTGGARNRRRDKTALAACRCPLSKQWARPFPLRPAALTCLCLYPPSFLRVVPSRCGAHPFTRAVYHNKGGLVSKPTIDSTYYSKTCPRIWVISHDFPLSINYWSFNIPTTNPSPAFANDRLARSVQSLLTVVVPGAIQRERERR